MAKLLPLRMRATDIQRIVRQRAEASDRIIITAHAQQRMDERGVSFVDVLAILRNGGVYVAPFKNEQGDWQTDVERRMPGGREAVAITVVPQGQMLIVRTVMWRDER